MSRQTLLLTSLVLWLVGCAEPPGPPAATHRAETPWPALLERTVELGVTGITLIVDRPGGEHWEGAAGLASIATQTPLTLDHAIHWGSISKQVTAALVLGLVDAGELDLDTPLLEVLPDPEVAALPHSAEVQIGQLLDHSSGFYATNNDPEYIRDLVGARAGEHVHWTPRDFLARAALGEPRGLPGTGHYYSDTNYILAGLVVERLTGESLPARAASALFEPLGMGATYFLSTLGPSEPPPVLSARGHLQLSEELEGLIHLSRFEEVAPGILDTTSAGERLDGAGGIVGTAGDLYRFADAYLRGDLLSAASRERVLSAARALGGGSGDDHLQRITSARRTPHGVVITSEGDGPGGCQTLVAFDPASGVLVVALVNHFGLFDDLTEFLLDEIVARAIEAPSL